MFLLGHGQLKKYKMGCLSQEGATLMVHKDATSQTVAIKATSWAISFSDWVFGSLTFEILRVLYKIMFSCKVGDGVASWSIWPDVFV